MNLFLTLFGLVAIMAIVFLLWARVFDDHVPFSNDTKIAIYAYVGIASVLTLAGVVIS